MMQENNIDAKTNSGVADEELRQTMISMDFTVLTTSPRLAQRFGVPTVSLETIEDAKDYAEAVSGEVILWFIQTKHSVHLGLKPNDLQDEGESIGICVFSRESWEKRFPNTPYVPTVVQAITQHFLEFRLWYMMCCQP